MEENDFIKLTNVAYRILDFFPDGDPLKYKAKEKVLAIMEHLTLISTTDGWMSLKKEIASAQVLDDIEILENYLSIGKNQGWLDNVNFLIITKEYEKIKSEIKPPKGAMRSPLRDPDKIEDSRQNRSNRGSPTESGQNLAIATPSPPVRHLATGDKESNREGNKETINNKRQLAGKDSQEIIEEYSQRQKKILQILATREKAQVSDMIKELPDITKRTVRRDLDDLLKKGKIMRIGEWNQVFYILEESKRRLNEFDDRTFDLS